MNVSSRIMRCAVVSCLLGLACSCPMARSQGSPAKKKTNAKDSQVNSQASKAPGEEWTTPTLERRSFVKKTPILSDTGDAPSSNFIRERYMANWREDDPFDLYVVRPKGVAKPPVILYLYTFPDDTELFKTDNWCAAVTKDGYAAVALVSALTGHRLRFRAPKESFVTEMQEALAETAHDVQLILDYLETRRDVDSSRVGMFSVGSGASIAILTSAVDPRIQAVDLLGPWGDWPGWMEHSKIIQEDLRANFVKPEFLAKVEPLDPIKWLPRMKAKIVRIQNIRGNKSMPDESQEKLEAAAPYFALVNEYGNGRAYLTLQPPAMAFQWLKDQLKEGATLEVAKEKSGRIHFFPAIQEKAVSEQTQNQGTVAAKNKEQQN